MPVAMSLPMGMPPMVFAIGVTRQGPKTRSFRLHGLWCIHLYRNHGELVVGGHRMAIEPGHASLIPPDTQFEHIWSAQVSYVAVHFAPHGEYLCPRIPVIQAMGERFERAYLDLVEATHWLGREQERLNARVYDVLWRIADPEAPLEVYRRTHPALTRAENLVRAKLGDPFTVSDLAEEAGISHNHLIRLFRTEHGTTIQGYVRRQRALRARHLLVHTTMSIKAIAREVGVGNLQQFNKLIKREFDRSPRDLRRADPEDALGTGFERRGDADWEPDQ